MFRQVVTLCVVVVLSGCAISSGLPPAPAQVKQVEYAYRLNPGDQLDINVWRNPEVSTKVPVRPDGRVTIPLVEDLQASGKTPAELAREIEKGLAKYIRDPSVSVIVTQVADSFRDQVRVTGEVVKPTTVTYRPRMTLLDAMTAAGGLSKLAAGNRAVLMRASENNKQYSIRVRDLVAGADMSANVELLPGDVITVPQSAF